MGSSGDAEGPYGGCFEVSEPAADAVRPRPTDLGFVPEREQMFSVCASLADQRADLTQRHRELSEVVHALHREVPHEPLQARVRFGPPLKEGFNGRVDLFAGALLDHTFGELSPYQEDVVLHRLDRPSLP